MVNYWKSVMLQTLSDKWTVSFLATVLTQYGMQLHVSRIHILLYIYCFGSSAPSPSMLS